MIICYTKWLNNQINDNLLNIGMELLKEDFRSNTYFDKLLINRVEHQVLTEIYRSYENKEEFNRTNYYINEIKNIINHEGVEKAIQFLENIEPLELREKIAKGELAVEEEFLP